MRINETSLAAYREIQPLLRNQLEQAFWAIQASINDRPNREDVEFITGLNSNAVRPAVWRLIFWCLVIEGPDKKRTRAGRDAWVLRIAPGATLEEVRHCFREIGTPQAKRGSCPACGYDMDSDGLWGKAGRHKTPRRPALPGGQYV